MLNTKHNLSVSRSGADPGADRDPHLHLLPHAAQRRPARRCGTASSSRRSTRSTRARRSRPGRSPQPSGPTKLCLSCHDGTIAMGAVLNPPGGIAMSGSGSLPPGSLADFGLDLSGHHPVSFSYSAALPNAELAAVASGELVFGGTDEVHCSTCHDPHNDEYGRFLVKDNRFSALCITCHTLTGWSGLRPRDLDRVDRRDPAAPAARPGRTGPTLAEWGCEACHAPHFAADGGAAAQLHRRIRRLRSPARRCHGPSQPRRAAALSATARQCHARTAVRPALAALTSARQVSKPSAHHESDERSRPGCRAASAADRAPDPRASAAPTATIRTSRTIEQAEPPYVSGLLRGVRGVDRNGAEVATATYEYEICFKCHGDNTPDCQYVPRVVGEHQHAARLRRRQSVVPPGRRDRAQRRRAEPALALSPRLTPVRSDRLHLVPCRRRGRLARPARLVVRADPEGALRDRRRHAGESYENYALCYRCHERTSILADRSFRHTRLPHHALGRRPQRAPRGRRARAPPATIRTASARRGNGRSSRPATTPT